MKIQQNKKILVTGGAGFIGTNLIDRLISKGNRVYCLDNFITGNINNLSHHKDNSDLTIMKWDVIQPLDIEVDMIFNLACPASPPFYQADPIHTLKTSVYGAENMAQLALKNNCPIFHASTSEIYGDPLEHPQKETDWGNVNTLGIRACYDEGKRAAEALLYDYKRTHKLDLRMARIFNTYGPNMQSNDGRVISNFINQTLSEKDMTIYGEGLQTRSFCYVEDTINAIELLMNLDVCPDSPVNIGNPDEYTMLDIAKTISDLCGKPNNIVHKSLPQDDPTRRKPDISLAIKLLGWKPGTSLTEGLLNTIRYFKEKME